jgi:hypothetical protein
MRGELKKVIESNLKLVEKLAESLPSITDALGETKFKYASKALLSFIPKSGYLTSAILDCCQNGNPYVASILFRSLIEHSFRHLYIYTKTLRDNTDLAGEDYYGPLKGSEDLNSLRKIAGYKKVVSPEETQWSFKGEHNKNIGESAKQFEIQNIFIYLVSNTIPNEELVHAGLKNYLLERLIEYTNMSSSVHGDRSESKH